MGHEPEWKVEKQPRWLVAAIKKTISSLHGGYEEAAEWLDVTKDALFNRRVLVVIRSSRLGGRWYCNVPEEPITWHIQ